MNRRFLTAAGIALLGAVAGCHSGETAFTDNFCSLPQHYCLAVSVSASSNQISVDRDTLTKHGAGSIRWTIINTGSQKFFFAGNGIAFGAPEFHCSPVPLKPLLFECNDSGKPGDYKYTVTVSGGNPTPTPYDPHVVNN